MTVKDENLFLATNIFSSVLFLLLHCLNFKTFWSSVFSFIFRSQFL